MAGSAAQIRSVIIDKTTTEIREVAIYARLRASISVSDSDVHDLAFRETGVLDTHAPVCAQRPAHSQDQEKTDHTEERHARHERIHSKFDCSRVDYAKQEQADRNLGEQRSSKVPDQVGPAYSFHILLLRRYKVILISS